MSTLENFSELNRNKQIGNSNYRICKEDGISEAWYIYESYDNGVEWEEHSACYHHSFEKVAGTFGRIDKEKVIVSLKL